MIETELCAFSTEACRIAARNGVTRVELCASPYEGGTTPSAAAIRAARRIEGLQLSVMIRPRGGDFLYTDEEFQLRRANYSAHCMPFTKESLFYREIFEKYYHDQSRTIVGFWMPNKAWPGCNVNDPSARVLANYGASGV
mgnify:CR=1 FL=1